MGLGEHLFNNRQSSRFCCWESYSMCPVPIIKRLPIPIPQLSRPVKQRESCSCSPIVSFYTFNYLFDEQLLKCSANTFLLAHEVGSLHPARMSYLFAGGDGVGIGK